MVITHTQQVACNGILVTVSWYAVHSGKTSYECCGIAVRNNSQVNLNTPSATARCYLDFFAVSNR